MALEYFLWVLVRCLYNILSVRLPETAYPDLRMSDLCDLLKDFSQFSWPHNVNLWHTHHGPRP